MAVVRDESQDPHLPPVSDVAKAVAAAAIPEARALQIDFDATLSQRSFYRDLLAVSGTVCRSLCPFP